MTEIKVIDSWKIKGIGIIADLQHSFDGLSSGTILISTKSNFEWKVMDRRIFSHSSEYQKRFKSENEGINFLKFKTLVDRKESLKKIMKNENACIFQYRINCIGHDNKPLIEEQLIIKTPHNSKHKI